MDFERISLPHRQLFVFLGPVRSSSVWTVWNWGESGFLGHSSLRSASWKSFRPTAASPRSLARAPMAATLDWVGGSYGYHPLLFGLDWGLGWIWNGHDHHQGCRKPQFWRQVWSVGWGFPQTHHGTSHSTFSVSPVVSIMRPNIISKWLVMSLIWAKLQVSKGICWGGVSSRQGSSSSPTSSWSWSHNSYFKSYA